MPINSNEYQAVSIPHDHNDDDLVPFDLDLELLPNPPEDSKPFEYVFNYEVDGLRQSHHKPSDACQVHVIQDFEFNEQAKTMSYRSKYVVVVILAAKFSTGSLIVTACSACASNQNLQMFLPYGSCINIQAPVFLINRFMSCKHSASVVAGLCDRHRVSSRMNTKKIHDCLAIYLKDVYVGQITFNLRRRTNRIICKLGGNRLDLT